MPIVLGTLLLLLLLAAVTWLLSRLSLPRPIKHMLYAALAIRVAASLGYLGLNEIVYAGVGDYKGYHLYALIYTEQIFDRGLAGIADRTLWYSPDTLWGTQFVAFLTTAVEMLFGRSIINASVVFSLFGFAGIVASVLAMRRLLPEGYLVSYTRWVVLLPSLWFWPSAIGKDTINLLGVGLVMLALSRGAGKIAYGKLLFGLACVFVIRPQVTALVFVCVVLAYYTSFEQRWTIARVAQAVVVLVGAAIGLLALSSTLNLDLFSADQMTDYMSAQSEYSSYGGSAIESGSFAMAIPNILFRPFLWDGGGTILVSALEITFFWVMVAIRWQDLKALWPHFRRSLMVRFGLTFVLLFALAVGTSVGNLGIISRQRIPIFLTLALLPLHARRKHEEAPLVGMPARAPGVPRPRPRPSAEAAQTAPPSSVRLPAPAPAAPRP